MNNKSENQHYMFPGHGQGDGEMGTICPPLKEGPHISSAFLPHTKVKQEEEFLGLPINHPSFQSYKMHPHLQRSEQEFLNTSNTQDGQLVLHYNMPTGEFDMGRQYMAPMPYQNQLPMYSHPNFTQDQSPSYSFHAQYQGRLGQNAQSSPVDPIMQANVIDGNKTAIPNRAVTPVDNVSANLGGESPYLSRKRSRRSDYGAPGDEGDNELKQIALSYFRLPLSELAKRIKSIENDSSVPETKTTLLGKDTSKERQRQIFGMVWLLNSCESSPTAVVPRNRIYARYVQVCAEHSLKPLSPASFGKLVRISFPNLTTRRLGMRGQSKYHYCGIKLIGEQSTQSADSPMEASTPGRTDSPLQNNPNTPTLSNSPGMTSAYLSNVSSPMELQIPSEFQHLNLKYISGLFNSIDISLKSDNGAPLSLPSIYPYLPKDTDYDIADTLYSLKKIHCTSVFEFLRFMRVNELFSSFNGFSGILTVPVFKLYTHESMLPWVVQCDSIMYRAMTKLITKLQHQTVPSEVLLQLKYISSNYLDRLSSSLQNKVPREFMKMKLNLAKSFLSILNRLIKVIETGAVVSKIFNNSAEKQNMVNDWMKLDIKEIVLREVPCSKENVETLLKVLNSDFLDLFNDSSQESLQPSLIRCSNFLADLPSKFAKVNPRLFTLVLSNFFTACLREISLRGGQSFGAWWMLRCWVDEYINWCFEVGGMMLEEFENKELKDTKDNSKILEQREIHQDVSQADSNTSFVDLLDGAYGNLSGRDGNNDNMALNYDSASFESILGKGNDILS